MIASRNLRNHAWIRKTGKVSKCLFFALFFPLAVVLPARANNLMVENVTFTERNTMDHYGKIRFDISWDNSWRVSEAPANRDAAWIFAKWKHKSGAEWFHCTLSITDDEHTSPAGAQIDASFTKDNNGKGVPGYAGGKNSGVAGAGSRGGSWYTNATHLRVSGRQKGGFVGTYRTNTTGFRCVRSAW